MPVWVLPQGSAASTPAPFMYREGQTVACGPQRVGPGLPSMWSSLGTNLPPETRKTLIYNGPHYRWSWVDPFLEGRGKLRLWAHPMACTGQPFTDAPLASLAWPFSNIKGDGNTVFFLGVFTIQPKPLSSGEHFPQGSRVPESGSAWGLSTMLGSV